MKVIVIGGYPGSGKSTIVRGVIKELQEAGEEPNAGRFGSVRWLRYPSVIILGSYDEGEKFPGTDRLPMNVQPEAQTAMLNLRRDYPTSVVLLEGDRLFNDKFLNFLKSNDFDVVLCITFMARHLLEQRRNARSGQNEAWRKGRQTKVDRISMQHPVHHQLQNSTLEDQEESVAELLREIRGEWKSKKVESSIKNLWK